MALPDSYRRANELVGQYMNNWAIVEIVLVRVIAAAFYMEGMYGSVIGLNTTVREKIAIARTGVKMCLRSTKWKTMADHLLLRVADAADDRNMIAHTLFDAPEDEEGLDGVVFLYRNARAGLYFEDIHWSEAKFDEALRGLMTLHHHLREAEADLLAISPEIRRSVLEDDETTWPPFPPETLSVELPPPQKNSSSDQPKPRPKRERKQEQREKEVQFLRQQNAELKAALARFERR